MIDPFATVADSQIPPGVEIRYENVPVGEGQHLKRNFARLTLQDGETAAAGTARFQRWLSAIALPPGARFGLEEVGGASGDDGIEPRALRTFVLAREPILRTDGVTDARAIDAHDSGMDVYVAVTLAPDASQRFADATRAWTKRRIAIVVDDAITSVPLVVSEIRGGRISITMGVGDPAKKFEEAKDPAARLVRSLRPRARVSGA